MTRATPEHWLDAGLRLLRDGGHDALTIDALCRALGRTKGSFYHHFADVAAFSRGLLEHWERRNTDDFIVAADASGAAKRETLHASVRAVELGVERAIQAWALRDPAARDVQARVDGRRIAYLAGLRRAAGVKPRIAERMAQVEYAAFLGALQVFDLSTAEGWKAFGKANALLLRALEAVAAEP
ncbi:MAG: transcriptional regulator, TetR family [Labilithrix sp.]|nr:transcriptional regulator, TetR family [Labilithrix sp.]